MGLRAMRYVQRALVGRKCGAQRITASELPSRLAAGRCLSPPLGRDEPCWTLRQRCFWRHWSRALWSERRTQSRWACAPLRPRARPRRYPHRRRLHRPPHPPRRCRLHLRSPHLPPLEADLNLFRGKTVTSASMCIEQRRKYLVECTVADTSCIQEPSCSLARARGFDW